jgi:pimeloyl-ACP methyl ester carboxylesterase
MNEWDPAFLAGLAAQHRVIVFDYPGLGDSGRAPGTWNFNAASDWVSDFIAEVSPGAPVDVLGWSMGGFIAQRLAVRHMVRVAKADHAPVTVVIVFASWCGHCRRALMMLDALRAAHPRVRVLGLNYRGHEEYAQRGDATTARDYLARNAPWLRAVSADDALFQAWGSPPLIPTLFVLDRAGALIATFDRRDRATPTAGELAAVVERYGG